MSTWLYFAPSIAHPDLLLVEPPRTLPNFPQLPKQGNCKDALLQLGYVLLCWIEFKLTVLPLLTPSRLQYVGQSLTNDI